MDYECLKMLKIKLFSRKYLSTWLYECTYQTYLPCFHNRRNCADLYTVTLSLE